jgi:5-(aminomethyl)-3-furanmethanol phosphate kinase
MPIRIVKVGGSLLDWPGLPGALTGWLANQPPAVNVLLAGGGTLANTIKQADRSFSLGEENAHWLCIDAMSIAARLLAAALPEARLITMFDELRTKLALNAACNIVFDAREFLHEHESSLPGRVLPHDWSVTSDSIAARLSYAVTANELVLLKSCDPPAVSLSELADAGFVDTHFATVDWGRSPLRFVNLRAGRESSALALRLGGKLR